MNNDNFYTVTAECPVCEESFSAIKVKTSAIRLDHADDDYCMHYLTVNPLLYEIWVCAHCGYTNFVSTFTSLLPLELKELKKVCLMKFCDDPNKDPFELTEYHKQVYRFFDMLKRDGIRDNYSAIEAFQLMLKNLEIRNASASFKAKTLLRIGWIHRFLEDEKAEIEYLDAAAACFIKAYMEEDLSKGKFDYVLCAYLIGELKKRTGKVKDALEWFTKVLAQPKSDENARMMDKARDKIIELKSLPELKNMRN